MLKLNTESAEPFVPGSKLSSVTEEAHRALDLLLSGRGAGGSLTGWLHLPERMSDGTIEACMERARKWQETLDVVVIIGIGGSYLGTKCALKAFSHSFAPTSVKRVPRMVFAGHSLSEDYMADLLGFLVGKRFGLIVISKSGTTIEPGIAFRILKKALEESEGKEVARERILIITDPMSGPLRKMASEQGYHSFIIPTDVGGRYSVLSAVGLLPIAIAGFDIGRLIAGAKEMRRVLLQNSEDNIAVKYAALRNALYREGKKIEVFVNYHPKLKYLGEWLKQLFGESEGKGRRGLFPTTLDYTSDLHSVGQYIQDGERSLFETAVLAGSKDVEVLVPKGDDNSDGLDYLAGRSLEEINAAAEEGTRLAHVTGDVPNIYIEMERVDEYNMGQLFYFFEVSCAVSAYVLGVNPFDQPGVDVYKGNLYKLLGRPISSTD